MFTKKTQTDKPGLQKVIDTVLSEMEGVPVDSDEYAKMVDQLTKLYAIQDRNPNRVSADTLAMIGANLAGILVIVNHERVHVVTSKALGFVSKLRT